jgi:hypothetical protein
VCCARREDVAQATAHRHVTSTRSQLVPSVGQSPPSITRNAARMYEGICHPRVPRSAQLIWGVWSGMITPSYPRRVHVQRRRGEREQRPAGEDGCKCRAAQDAIEDESPEPRLPVSAATEEGSPA